MNVTGRELLVFGLVVLIVLLGGLWFLGWFGGFGSMGPGMMGPGMMGGFGWFSWLLACLIPLGLITLLVVGAIWLVMTFSRRPRGTSPPPDQYCPNCNRPVQADWQVCPYCGTSLRQEEIE